MSIETARLGMIVCSLVIVMLFLLNSDEIRHWFKGQIEKVIQRWRGQG